MEMMYAAVTIPHSSLECVCVLVLAAQSYLTLCDPGQNTRVGSLSLLQGIFPTQGLNPGLSHCRWILYQVSHQGSPN